MPFFKAFEMPETPNTRGEKLRECKLEKGIIQRPEALRKIFKI